MKQPHRRDLPPGFLFVELYTSDLPGYISFFRRVAGFRLIRDEGDFAELRSDVAVLLLNSDKESSDSHPLNQRLTTETKGVGVEIGVVLDNLEEAREAALGVAGWSVTEIHHQEWGLSDFRVLSPDGHYLRFTNSFR